MELALFGATGTSGSALLEQALAAGHRVRALARTPSKINVTDSALTITTGNALDATAVADTVAGADVVLSALGGFGDTDSIHVGTDLIITAMRENAVRRLIVVQGFHLDIPGDPHNPGRKLILPLLWLASRTLIRDSRAMAANLQDSDLDWTLLRVPRITRRAATGNRRVGRLKLGPFSSVTAGDIAAFAVDNLTDPATFRTSPMIANSGTHALGAAGYWLLGRRPAPASN